MFVFVFYVVLNDGVKSFWLEKFGLAKPPSKSGTASSTANNVYANTSAVAGSSKDQGHLYSSATEFPAKKDDNANL